MLAFREHRTPICDQRSPACGIWPPGLLPARDQYFAGHRRTLPRRALPRLFARVAARARYSGVFHQRQRTTDWEDYDLAEFEPMWEVIRAGDVPVMGFCGGHQFIALAFGAECGPLAPLAPGEADVMPEYQPGMRKERGFIAHDVLVKDDPLFDGFQRIQPGAHGESLLGGMRAAGGF